MYLAYGGHDCARQPQSPWASILCAVLWRPWGRPGAHLWGQCVLGWEVTAKPPTGSLAIYNPLIGVCRAENIRNRMETRYVYGYREAMTRTTAHPKVNTRVNFLVNFSGNFR